MESKTQDSLRRVRTGKLSFCGREKFRLESDVRTVAVVRRRSSITGAWRRTASILRHCCDGGVAVEPAVWRVLPRAVPQQRRQVDEHHLRHDDADDVGNVPVDRD
eukprot:7377703-Prymnesium_polylepis.1